LSTVEDGGLEADGADGADGADMMSLIFILLRAGSFGRREMSSGYLGSLLRMTDENCRRNS
jgi:hypothetical protein